MKGFSLFELLVVIAIVATILTFCLPIGSQTLDKNKVALVEKELITGMEYARSMALLIGSNLSLNPLVNEDWSQGMVLFVDNKTHHLSDKDKVLFQWHWHISPLQVKWYGFRSSAYLTLSSDLRHAAANGRFVILYQNIEVGHIKVNRMGRVIESSQPE